MFLLLLLLRVKLPTEILVYWFTSTSCCPSSSVCPAAAMRLLETLHSLPASVTAFKSVNALRGKDRNKCLTHNLPGLPCSSCLSLTECYLPGNPAVPSTSLFWFIFFQLLCLFYNGLVIFQLFKEAIPTISGSRTHQIAYC